MLLRRLAVAIRKQDWFTVLIEFLIVVTGIFVGLEVSNWNDSRKDRAREQANLERLLAESENAVAYISREIDYSEERIAAQRVLLEIVFGEDPIPEDTAQAEWGFTSLDFFPAMAPVRTAHDELTGSGGIQLISSRKVRDTISLYYADLDFYIAQQSYFRESSASAGNDPAVAAREYVKAIYDPNVKFGRRYVIDWAGLRTDPYLPTMFVGKLRNQIVMNSNREMLLSGAQNMCEALAAELGTDCVPALRIDAD